MGRHNRKCSNLQRLMQLLQCQQHKQLGMDKQQRITAISMAAAVTSTTTRQHNRSRSLVKMSAGEAQGPNGQLCTKCSSHAPAVK
jgi:hypothetical protein